jgi:hypothetical protein
MAITPGMVGMHGESQTVDGHALLFALNNTTSPWTVEQIIDAGPHNGGGATNGNCCQTADGSILLTFGSRTSFNSNPNVFFLAPDFSVVATTYIGPTGFSSKEIYCCASDTHFYIGREDTKFLYKYDTSGNLVNSWNLSGIGFNSFDTIQPAVAPDESATYVTGLGERIWKLNESTGVATLWKDWTGLFFYTDDPGMICVGRDGVVLNSGGDWNDGDVARIIGLNPADASIRFNVSITAGVDDIDSPVWEIAMGPGWSGDHFWIMIPNSDASARVGVEKRSIIDGSLISREYFNDAGYPGSDDNLGSYNTGIMEFRAATPSSLSYTPSITTSTVDCHIQPSSATNSTGEVLPAVGGTATLSCAGGGDVPSAPDATDSETWA